MTRIPAVAGRFYEDENEALINQIKDCFHHKLGPGALPISKTNGYVKAIISPHAGYMFSGPCAAWGFKEIAESEIAKTYIIIGPNHYGSGSSISFEDWKTPFGIIKTNKDLARTISEKSGIEINDSYHQNEHSIEVQLPFLQFVKKNDTTNLNIICITLSGFENVEKLAETLKELEPSNNITYIISSDFTHYGPSYDYVPFTDNVDLKLKDLDLKAIEYILNKDAQGFLDYMKRTKATICGYIPIYLLLKVLNNEKGELINYYKSTNIITDKSNSVSYASIIFR